MKNLKLLLVCALVVFFGTSAALSDWDPQDGHKMHYPQLPDPCGFDVSWMDVWALGDDWECSETGPVKDIHFWVSFADGYGDPCDILNFNIEIWSNNPGDMEIPWSHPDQMLWMYPHPTFTWRYVDTDWQGWFDPWWYDWWTYDHIGCYQINIENIPDPFTQNEGEIYWLVINDVVTEPGVYVGWKESNDHFMDDAVWVYDMPWWNELYDPDSGESMDLAFVITSEEEPEPNNIKWVQYPDLSDTGVDVDITECGPTGDDFECTTSGPILDIHLWGSWIYDDLPYGDDPTAMDFVIEIWSDNPTGPMGYSEPNEPLWGWMFTQGDFTASIYAQDLYEGYYVPCQYVYEPFGDSICWKYDFYIDPCDAFIQEGTPEEPVVYWLIVHAMPYEEAYFGWKTSLDKWNDDAVTMNWDMPPPLWLELFYPPGHQFEGMSMDLAFMITGECEAIEPKPLIEHSKWSQPPIEIDPTSNIPVYSGWDELSFREWVEPIWYDAWNCRTQCYGDADCNGGVWTEDQQILEDAWLIYDPRADFDRDNAITFNDATILAINYGTEPPPDCWLGEQWMIVADDFRCLGTMPITSVHWWGSYYYWEYPGTMPDILPIGWKICFWSNVPADPTGEPDYSYPEELLWQIEVDAYRVDINEVGTDSYHPEETGFPNDVCYQYTLQLEPEEWFWQYDYNDFTEDSVFWLSIAAIYDPMEEFIEFPWGWKTRPWHWMDDAVRFWIEGPPEPGLILDPYNYYIEPIKDPIYQESVDVAFELDTDPNYIKWEQHYTGIRDWPHYEDVPSEMAVWPEGVEWHQAVADDWPCDNNRPITALAWWGSYLDYEYMPCHGPTTRPEPPDWFWISIWTDVPDPDPGDPMTYSHPGEMIWDYNAYDFDEVLVGYDKDPRDLTGPPREPVFRYSVRIPEEEWFWQEEEEAVYWLMIVAAYEQRYPLYDWGWTLHEHVYNDDAVVGWPMIVPMIDNGEPWEWYEIFDQTGASADMSFILFTDPYVEPPPPPELDFGDANDPPYPTYLANDGARHIIDGPWLGPADDAPDPEGDGQPDPQALGDDNDGNDDEDGVTIPPLIQGIPAIATVEVTDFIFVGGVVELWIDFDGSGSWEAGELVYSGLLFTGVHPIPVTAPFGSVVGDTYARCRISSRGTGSPTGLAPDGEVEDHKVTIEAGLDFGDAPDPTYPTLLPTGARHVIVPGIMLGASIDVELDGQPDATATGDDNDGNDDEDGIVFTSPLIPGYQATVDVTASVPGTLNAWIDYYGDGDWDDSVDQVFTNVGLTGGGMTDTLTFTVPGSAGGAAGNIDTFARFRFDRAGGLSYTGQAPDGEVEDYMVHIEHKVKYSQPPEGEGVYFGWDELSIYHGLQIMADDWPCETQEPVSDIHWWGSYYEWPEPVPPPVPTPNGFHIGIWTNVPAGGPFPFSRPGVMIWEYYADIAEVNEYFVGFDDHPQHPPDSCFRYDLQLPEPNWFWQDGNPREPNIYWLSIAATYVVEPPDPYYWGWKTRPHFYNDDAIRIIMPTAPVIGDPFIDGAPIPGWDMAFELTTEDCLVVGQYAGGVLITQAMYDLWVSLGKPECWCYDCHWRGDTDGDCIVFNNDVTVAYDGWMNYVDGFCADTNNDGIVFNDDVTRILNGWLYGCTEPTHPDYPNSGTCTPIP